MAKVVGLGHQDFEDIRKNDLFYIDKTRFIMEWWENNDSVTLITRPRRFGKTLSMSMLEKFFSLEYAGRADLFEGLSVWQEEKYRALQGTYPVISLSFANVKEAGYCAARRKICYLLAELYAEHAFLLDSGVLADTERDFFHSISADMGDLEASMAIHQLAKYLYRYYGKKAIILLDEYDAPMQEAYAGGYWGEMVQFIRSMFNSAFKTNNYLERAIMTGITRVSKESVFSDLNNLTVITTTTNRYEDIFGFTEKEVFAALEEYGLSEGKGAVKAWYDGFTFGKLTDIYNPWSIVNYLKWGKLAVYWANTRSNSLVGRLIREGNQNIKMDFEHLMKGEVLETAIDEQTVFGQLSEKEGAVWNMLLASGYLKVADYYMDVLTGREYYKLALTNKEIRIMFENMIRDWFPEYGGNYNEFLKALLEGDTEAMNEYMNRMAFEMFSFFDTGKGEPERFYHGFVLGMMVGLEDCYQVKSNRESGFGRYDIMLVPKKEKLDAVIIEFKVRRPGREPILEDTVRAALGQIEEKGYAGELLAMGVPKGRIRKYGFAFDGKEVLVGANSGGLQYNIQFSMIRASAKQNFNGDVVHRLKF